MNLEISDAAKRDIKKIQDKNAKAAIIKAPDDFFANPKSLPLHKLEGYEKLWRISLDNWRLVLMIE
jgi:mRNA-degrading endonuclease RelE of RelBE toxin-antitoxin system